MTQAEVDVAEKPVGEPEKGRNDESGDDLMPIDPQEYRRTFDSSAIERKR
jgi:hypothetical protein